MDLNPSVPSFLSCALNPLIPSLQNCDHNKRLARRSKSLSYYIHRIWDSQRSIVNIYPKDSADNFYLNYGFFDYEVARGTLLAPSK